MPRPRLSVQDVVAAAAEVADEAGYAELTMGLVAQRLGIRTPSLYRHVDDLADLRRRVATQAVTELGEAVRDALPGQSGLDALTAMLTIRAYVTAHPGRYAATTGQQLTGRDPVGGTAGHTSLLAIRRLSDTTPVRGPFPARRQLPRCNGDDEWDEWRATQTHQGSAPDGTKMTVSLTSARVPPSCTSPLKDAAAFPVLEAGLTARRATYRRGGRLP